MTVNSTGSLLHLFHAIYTLQHSPGFLNARTWLADVRQHADPHLTCILVGNKVDLCQDESELESNSNAERTSSTRVHNESNAAKHKRQVSVEEAELFAKEEGLLFVESSAKSGLNVERAFEQAARDILDKIHRGTFDDDQVKSSSHSSNDRIC